MGPMITVRIEREQRPLSRNERRAWRMVQVLVWLVGAGIVGALILRPAVGLFALWNVLIPVAPALMLVAPGVWRNVCPLGSTALLARHLGLSAERRLAREWQARFLLIAVGALLLLVPLRHVVLDRIGPVTGFTILALALAAIVAGSVFDWKSGWCSGLCPLYPVEMLYGSKPLVAVPNAHCERCVQCTSPCPDSTPGVHSLTAATQPAQRIAGTIMAGGFVGFVWGWYQVGTYPADEAWSHLGTVYGFPFAGLGLTLAVFLVLHRLLPPRSEAQLVRSFAAAAIACYYWFRLPPLLGFAPTQAGALVDLSGALPAWTPAALRVATIGLVGAWLVTRPDAARSWAGRPPLAAAGRSSLADT